MEAYAGRTEGIIAQWRLQEAGEAADDICLVNSIYSMIAARRSDALRRLAIFWQCWLAQKSVSLISTEREPSIGRREALKLRE